MNAGDDPGRCSAIPLERLLAQEVSRLKEGHFTPDELQNLCHNLDDSDFDAFCDGCEAEQKKLFGRSRNETPFSRVDLGFGLTGAFLLGMLAAGSIVAIFPSRLERKAEKLVYENQELVRENYGYRRAAWLYEQDLQEQAKNRPAEVIEDPTSGTSRNELYEKVIR